MTGGANFLQALGWAVLNSLWQLALLWIDYQLITGIFKKTGASSKSTLATLLLTGGFIWFVYTFFAVFGKSTSSEIIADSPIVNATMNPELNDWLQKTLPIASILYLLLLVFPTMQFIRNYRYVRVIRQYGLSKIDPQWRIFVKKIAGYMGIRSNVRIWISELVKSPVTVGFLKPIILVPVAAVNHLTPQQLEAVLLHELAHIRRYDYVLNLLIHFIHTILYFNPFAKAFVKIVEKEREKSCDEMVLQFQYDSHEYASALLLLEKAGQASPAFSMPAGGKKADLLSRVELILGVEKKKVVSFNNLAGFFAGLLCVIALNALLIINKPASANKAPGFASLKNAGELFRHSSEIGEDPTTSEITATAETEQPSAVINHLDLDGSDESPRSTASEEGSAISHSGFIASAVEQPAFIPVAFTDLAFPLLNEEEKLQVRSAIDASKKLIASTQWKQVEKDIADVFTQKEKDELKKLYRKELEKVNWKEIENKLAMAYGSIEWEKVNLQLNQAVTEIRFDSLQRVYADAIMKIDDVKKELEVANLEGIPDSEYDIPLLEEKKSELTRQLNLMKARKVKKIVRL
jgi:beta-lactamase regulating signal transducer with metallopeptidase domain